LLRKLSRNSHICSIVATLRSSVGLQSLVLLNVLTNYMKPVLPLCCYRKLLDFMMKQH